MLIQLREFFFFFPCLFLPLSPRRVIRRVDGADRSLGRPACSIRWVSYLGVSLTIPGQEEAVTSNQLHALTRGARHRSITPQMRLTHHVHFHFFHCLISVGCSTSSLVYIVCKFLQCIGIAL